MKSSEIQTLCVCGCYKRSPPASAFCINRKTGLPGNYCEECRKTVSRNHRKSEKRSLTCNKESSYPVIASTEDPTLRRELILHTLGTVAVSIKRKRRKTRESEFESESGSEFQPESVFELELESKSGSELELAN